MNAKPRIAVLGGGFGGLESLFYLKYKLGDRADLTLVSDEPKFLFKPNTIYIPFGEPLEGFEVDLTRPLRKQAIEFVNARVENIDPDNRTVATGSGNVDYDYLVVATGAKMRSAESLDSTCPGGSVMVSRSMRASRGTRWISGSRSCPKCSQNEAGNEQPDY